MTVYVLNTWYIGHAQQRCSQIISSIHVFHMQIYVQKPTLLGTVMSLLFVAFIQTAQSSALICRKNSEHILFYQYSFIY